MGTWQPIGPNQVLTSKFGKVTGRITSLAIDTWDKSGATVYVGTTGGGVWKSTNAAASADQVIFSPLTDNLPAFSSEAAASLSIGALTVQPGGTGVVLAGTGDPNDSLDSYYGSGLLRSNDNGTTWTLITQSSDGSYGPYQNFSLVGKGFAGFAWSTVAPNLVVAAISDAAEGTVVNASIGGTSVQGLYYSNDAGATWLMSSIQDSVGQWIQRPDDDFSGWDGNAATAVAWNPIRKKFYAAIRYHGYYESPDGMTWTRLASQPGLLLNKAHCPTTFNGPGSQTCRMFRGALSVQPFTGDLFAFSVDQDNKDVGLWQDVCTLKSGGCTSSTVAFSKQISTASLEYWQSDDPARHLQSLAEGGVLTGDTLLYTGTTDISRCSLAAGCVWRNTTNALTCAAAKVSPFQHAIDFLPGIAGQPFPGLIFFGNDGGLWRTTNGIVQPSPACSADDAKSFDNLNAGIGSLAEITSFAQDPNDENVLLAGLGANGTAAQSVAGQTTWPQVLDGLGTTTAIDPVNPQYWYTTSANGVTVERCSVGVACTRSDFGSPAISESTVGGDGSSHVGSSCIHPGQYDPSQILVGTCRVWRGPANGSSWSSSNAISGMLDKLDGPGLQRERHYSIAGLRADSERRIHLRRNGRAVGRERNCPRSSVPRELEWLRFHVGRYFHVGGEQCQSALQSREVCYFKYRSRRARRQRKDGICDCRRLQREMGFLRLSFTRARTGGAHWTNMNSNLPWSPAISLVVDPQDAETLYVALDTGVYVTHQISDCDNPLINCWSVFGTGLPNASCHPVSH